MKKIYFLVGIVTLLVTSLGIYSCQKGDNTSEIILKTDGIVKFSDGRESSLFYSPITIEKISNLDKFVNHKELSDIKKNINLKLEDIELLTYEKSNAKVLISNKSENEKDVVYLVSEKNIYAKALIEDTEDGNKLFRLVSYDGKKTFYSVIFNNKNEIKDLKINQDLVRRPSSNLKSVQMSMSSNSETCMESTSNFNDCMLCAIKDECGSDWVCTATCMVAPVPCLVGFGIGCAFF